MMLMRRNWKKQSARLQACRLNLRNLFGESEDAGKSVEAQAEATAKDPVWAAIARDDWPTLHNILLQRTREGAALSSIRGAVGETVLHFAYLLGKKEIAHQLLKLDPSLIRTVYAGAEYRGESVLHMAIANKELAEARFLVGLCPELIWTRADGVFFGKPTESEGDKDRVSVYYGELPLGFAVATNQAAFVRFLVVECGAWISAGDQHGNTAAHVCVTHDRADMYGLLEELWSKGYGRPPQHGDLPLSAIRNAAGQTPLVLAAALGKRHMLESLWERSKTLEWAWGSVRSTRYPLSYMDSLSQVMAAEKALAAPPAGVDGAAGSAAQGSDVFAPAAAFAVPPAPEFQPFSEPGGAGSRGEAASADQGAASDDGTPRDDDKGAGTSYDPPAESLYGPFPTVLDMCVEGGHEELVDLPLVKRLLERKWRRFAYRMFIRRLLWTLAFLLLFACVSVFRTQLDRGVVAPSDAAAAAAALSPPIICGAGDVWSGACTVSASEGSIPERASEPQTGYNELQLLRDPRLCAAGSRTLCAATTAGEVLVIAGAVIKLWGFVRRGARMGVGRLFRTGGAGPLETVLPVTGLVCLLAGFAADFMRGPGGGALFLSAAGITGWLHFGAVSLLGFPGTGPFIVMIMQMLTQDFLRFGVLAGVVIVAFTQAFFLLTPDAGLSGFLARMRLLLVAMISDAGEDTGLPQGEVGDGTPAADAAAAAAVASAAGNGGSGFGAAAGETSGGLAVLSLVFELLSKILLINLLVALMGNTFDRIFESAKSHYHLERARIILAFEEDMTPAERLAEANKYYIELGDAPYLQVQEEADEHWANEEAAAALSSSLESVQELPRADASALHARLWAAAAASPSRQVTRSLSAVAVGGLASADAAGSAAGYAADGSSGFSSFDSGSSAHGTATDGPLATAAGTGGDAAAAPSRSRNRGKRSAVVESAEARAEDGRAAVLTSNGRRQRASSKSGARRAGAGEAAGR